MLFEPSGGKDFRQEDPLRQTAVSVPIAPLNGRPPVDINVNQEGGARIQCMRIKIFAGKSADVERDANRWLQENKNFFVEKLSTAKDQGVLTLTLLYSDRESSKDDVSAALVSQTFLEDVGGLPPLEVEQRN